MKNSFIRFFVIPSFIISLSIFAQLDYGVNYDLKYFVSEDVEDGSEVPIFENYFESISKENNLNVNRLDFMELKKNKLENIWIICPKDLMDKKCEKIQTNDSFKFKIIENIEFNKVNLKLINIK